MSICTVRYSSISFFTSSARICELTDVNPRRSAKSTESSYLLAWYGSTPDFRTDSRTFGEMYRARADSTRRRLERSEISNCTPVEVGEAVMQNARAFSSDAPCDV